MFLKFAKSDILDVKKTRRKVVNPSLAKFSKFEDYKTDDGYLYVRVRAISSRVNKNHDGWPSEELKKSYSTFLGKPIFVDHHNSDPKKARGVVVDAVLHVEDDLEKTASLDPYYANAPSNHLPPTWIELLLEVDAQQYPKLAKAIINNDIDGVSMGANVERSICSHCKNEATSPEEYCKHILSKGAYFDYVENGIKTSKRSYEDCYDITFFELSFVFDPADETALKLDHKAAHKQKIAKEVHAEAGYPDDDDEERAPGMDYCPHGYPDGEGCPDCEESPQGLGGELPSFRDSEAERVRQWKIDELIRAGYPPEEAEELAEMTTEQVLPGDNAYPIYRDLISLIERGATPEQARRIVTRRIAANNVRYLKCPTCGAPSRYIVNDVCANCGESVTNQNAQPRPGGMLPPRRPDNPTEPPPRAAKTAKDNPPPQSEMVTMPESIDTLRQDQICPICGSDMEDGQCEVCNYQEPPEGFNNPDLEKAKEVDKQLHEELEQQAYQQEEPNIDNQVSLEPNQGPQGGVAPGDLGMAMPMASTSKQASTTTVSGERKISAQPNQGTRINTQERPILPATRKLTDKPKNQKTVKDSKEPVESKNKENNIKMTETTQKVADGASPAGEGTQADKRVDVEGVGAVSGDPLTGITHENVEKDTGDFVAPHTDTWSGEEGDSLPAADPVTSDAGEDLQTVSSRKTAEGIQTWDSPGNGFPDHDPARVDLEAGLAEEVGDRTMTDSTGTAFRTLEQANPVDKGDNGNQVGGPIGEAVARAKAQVVKAMKIAETEVALGLVEADAKFERVAELENASEEVLDAQLEVLAKVRSAGLRKAVTPSQRSASAGRMPSFKPVTAAVDIDQHSVTDQEIEDTIGW